MAEVIVYLNIYLGLAIVARLIALGSYGARQDSYSIGVCTIDAILAAIALYGVNIL